jgi:hypothetical protein
MSDKNTKLIEQLAIRQKEAMSIILKAWGKKYEDCEHRATYIGYDFISACGILYHKPVLDEDKYIPCHFLYCPEIVLSAKKKGRAK